MDWIITEVSSDEETVTIKAQADVPIDQFAALVNDLPTPEPPKPKKKAKKKKPGKHKKQKPKTMHFGRGHPKPKPGKNGKRKKKPFDKLAYDKAYRDRKRAEKVAAAKAAPGSDNEISDKKMAKMQEIDNGIKKVQKQQDDIYRKERP